MYATATRYATLEIMLKDLESCLDREHVRVEEIVDALGPSSFVSLLLVPALLVVTPLSGIPLFSSVCGIIIALISIQMVLNQDHIWLPAWVESQEISSRTLTEAVGNLRKFARWIENYRSKRFRILVREPMLTVQESICLVCGTLMPFLEIVPFTSSLLGAIVSLFALAMLNDDGLLALIGIAGVAVITLIAVNSFSWGEKSSAKFAFLVGGRMKITPKQEIAP